MKVNAQILLARCKKSQQLYGIRIQQVDGNDWAMTWAFTIDETRASHEGFDKTKITADCYVTDEYPGCPNCGSLGYVRCGYCGKLTCYNDETSMKCAWCRKTLNNIEYAGAMDLSAGDY